MIGCPNSFSNTGGTTHQALFSAVDSETPRVGKPIRPCGVLTSAVTVLHAEVFSTTYKPVGNA